MNEVFHPSTSAIFVGLAQVGLVLLMFQIGLEFEFRRHLGRERRLVAAVSAAGIVVPFALGYAAAPWFHAQLAEPRPALPGFRLFFAVAMSITAIPILGRIFMELGLSHTRTAALTIAAAAVNDVLGWLLLGAISLLATGSFSVEWGLLRLAGLLLFGGAVIFAAGPPLRRLLAAHRERHGRLRPEAFAWILILLFAAGCATSLLGVFAILGGFIAGLALHEDRAFVAEWRDRVGPLVFTFFLPIFFAYTGLRTDIGTFGGAHGAWLCLLVIGLAFAGKFGGTFLAARLMGEPARSAATIGVCMNTRALMELIVLNIGMDIGVLPRDMFTMLVIMALASTFVAAPLIRRLMRGQELAEERPAAPAAGVAESVRP
jgi:Kef-type K+ transport system membrane component KefB